MEDYFNFTFNKSARQWDAWVKWINKLYSYDKERLA